MDFLNIIKERRSIRKFEDREIPKDVEHTLLEAVQWSQSWANTQCWEVLVVKDKDVRSRLQETMGKGNPASKAIVDAPLLVGLAGRLQSAGYYKGQEVTKFGDWFLFDLGLATQNLCLTAHALGLGSVVVGLFDHDKAKEALAIPDGYELPVLVPLGYPAQSPKPPQRRDIEEFLHYERF
ncbi:MAG: nitroreductase family protein [Desulfohalobiaceae bacterium]|nr:nitroreductase family protein [Desulfohalobiaceae bacterium]